MKKSVNLPYNAWREIEIVRNIGIECDLCRKKEKRMLWRYFDRTMQDIIVRCMEHGAEA